MLANVNRDPKRTPRSFTPADFMPQMRAEAATEREDLDDLLAFAGSLGAEVIVARDS